MRGTRLCTWTYYLLSEGDLSAYGRSINPSGQYDYSLGFYHRLLGTLAYHLVCPLQVSYLSELLYIYALFV